MFKSIFAPILGVIAFITIIGLFSQGKLDFLFKNKISQVKTSAKAVEINNIKIDIEVAKTNEERSRGLSNRTNLPEDSGMVFIFDKDTRPTFWMKDTKIPLDLIWINDNKIVGIDKNVQPEPNVSDAKLKRYPSPSAIDYVLEVNGGVSDKKGFKVGQMISGLEQL